MKGTKKTLRKFRKSDSLAVALPAILLPFGGRYLRYSPIAPCATMASLISAVAWVRRMVEPIQYACVVEKSTLPVIPPYCPTLPQIPRGAVKRVPVRQELSSEELAFLKRQAAEEEALNAAGGDSDGSDSEGNGDDDSAAASAAGAAAAAASSGGGSSSSRGRDPMDDPAFASLRDVKLPPGMELDDDEDVGSGGELDGDDDDDEGEGSDGGEGEREGVRAGLRADRVEKKALGSRMADIDAPEAFDDDEDEEPEDIDDLTAKADDAFLLVANTEDDHSSLELHCYNTGDGSLYVHHDITLPAFPLCVAWMDYAGDAAAQNAATQAALMSGAPLRTAVADAAKHVGSYVAVGTFKPHIEIWNTDVLDPLEPTLVLRGASASSAKGGEVPAARRKKGQTAAAAAAAAASSASSSSSSSSPSSGGHTDAVMALAWNRTHRHLLASGSADTTVKIWDVDGGGRVLHTFTHHKGKVQGVAWNDAEPTILATCSYDRTAAVIDARAADKGRVARFALPSSPESLLWYVHNPAVLLATCEDGSFLGWDVRAPNTPLFSVRAHGTAATSVAASPLARGLLATGSRDKSVKVWDLHAAAGTGAGAAFTPQCIASKVMTIGQVFTVSFFPNAPFLLAAGGSKGILAVWDIAADGGEPAPGLPRVLEGEGVDPPVSVSGLMPEGASATARRFGARLADPGTLRALEIRPRTDGQPLL